MEARMSLRTCPSERFGIGVVPHDERGDVGPEGCDAAIDAAPDLLIGEEREEAFDLNEPRRAGRGQVTFQRGLFASHFRISGILCVA